MAIVFTSYQKMNFDTIQYCALMPCRKTSEHGCTAIFYLPLYCPSYVFKMHGFIILFAQMFRCGQVF